MTAAGAADPSTGSGAPRPGDEGARVSPGAGRTISLWKKLVFALVTTAALLVLLELGLAVLGVRPILHEKDPYVGFSAHIPLFVEVKRSELERPAGSPIMMTAANKVHAFNVQRFARHKPAGAYRVFCLGGSTTYGRPYGDATSFCGWLREILRTASGSHEWEVINAGGISYASYRVAALMEELSQYDPDLFIVYSGHNEFLEARTYGAIIEMPAAVRGLGALLSGTRLYSTLSRLVHAGRKSAPEIDSASAELPAEVETLLDVTVGPEAYTRDDELHKQILSHYRFNLSRMVDIALSAGAAVLFVRPASNLRDFSPFKSEHRAGISAAQRSRLEALFAEGRRARESGRLDEALRVLDEAAAIDGRHAELQYQRGKVLLALGRQEEAREALVHARDEDICPLRALSEIERIVGAVAAGRDVPLVDFVAIAREHSKHGIPGEDVFLDHVHPTIECNRLLALSILESLIALGIATPDDSWGDEALRGVVRSVEGRLDTTSHGIALRNLSKVLAWAGKLEEADRLALKAVAMVPQGDAEVHFLAGVTHQRRGALGKAVAHFQRAIRIDPYHSGTNVRLGALYLARGDHERARLHLERALVLVLPLHRPGLNYSLGRALAQGGDLAGAIARFERTLEARPQYAEAHVEIGIIREHQGDPVRARARYESALRIRSDLVTAHYNLARILAVGGDSTSAREHFEEALRLEPDAAEACGDLGALLVGQGDLVRARALLKRAIEIKPDFAPAHYNLGHLLFSEGDLINAGIHFERALRAKPDYTAARRYLDRVSAALQSRR